MKRTWLKRTPLKKKSDRQKFLEKLDAVFKKYFLKLCKKEPTDTCEWCGRTKFLYMAHILPKGAYSKLRYACENILLLCYHCHMVKWHRNPLEAAEFLEAKKGKDYKDKLKVLNATKQKYTSFHLALLYESLKGVMK